MKPKMTLVPLAVSLALAACGGGAPKKLPPPEAPVRVAKVERQAVPLEVAAVGHVEASSIVSVKPQVGGVVLKVGFREGEDVAVGQILFQIDPRPFQAALAQAKANLERDRARLAEAERTLVRYEELIKKEYVTQEQLDGARANSAALKATVVGDEAAVEQSRLNLAYCQIESPVAGRTGSLLVYAGNVVKAGDDKPLVILNQIEPVRVSFAVPERVLADVKARSREGKLKVTVTPPGGAPHEGELTFVDNAVDSTTGTITLKATFANRDRALWPGQFAQVALNLATDAADPRVVKRCYSALVPGSSDLARVLEQRGIETVLIGGTTTNVCCESTARDAMMMDFKTVMVADTLSAVTEHEHIVALHNWMLFFGDVLGADEVAARLVPS